MFRFRTLIRPYYRGAAGMVLVYDVTDEKTFQNIEVMTPRSCSLERILFKEYLNLFKLSSKILERKLILSFQQQCFSRMICLDRQQNGRKISSDQKSTKSVLYSSGSQKLVVGDPQNRIKRNLETHIVLNTTKLKVYSSL